MDRACVITRPTTDAVGQTWCDIVATAQRPDRAENGAKFVTRGASVDAGPRWTPQMPGPAFGVCVYAREAVITDIGSGQALCGPRSELTGIFAKARLETGPGGWRLSGFIRQDLA